MAVRYRQGDEIIAARMRVTSSRVRLVAVPHKQTNIFSTKGSAHDTHDIEVEKDDKSIDELIERYHENGSTVLLTC